MESKTARLTILIDPDKKKTFEALCASQDLNTSQVVRHLSVITCSNTVLIMTKLSLIRM